MIIAVTSCVWQDKNFLTRTRMTVYDQLVYIGLDCISQVADSERFLTMICSTMEKDGISPLKVLIEACIPDSSNEWIGRLSTTLYLQY